MQAQAGSELRTLMVVFAVASLDFTRSASMRDRFRASWCCSFSRASSRPVLLMMRWNSASYVLLGHQQDGNSNKHIRPYG